VSFRWTKEAESLVVMVVVRVAGVMGVVASAASAAASVDIFGAQRGRGTVDVAAGVY